MIRTLHVFGTPITWMDLINFAESTIIGAS